MTKERQVERALSGQRQCDYCNRWSAPEQQLGIDGWLQARASMSGRPMAYQIMAILHNQARTSSDKVRVCKHCLEHCAIGDLKYKLKD